MIDWLEKSTHFPKFFYKGRDTAHAWAACGAKREYSSIPKRVTSRVFGAQAFLPFPIDDPHWSAFSSCYFFEPKEIRQGPLPSQKAPRSLIPQTKICLPDQPRWEEGVLSTQKCIQEGLLKKAVLARVTTFSFEEVLNPWDILRMLLSSTKNATVFALSMAPGALFLGASPERLYRRSGRTLLTEAIAGTCPLSASDEELLTSHKDLHEFGIVKEGISAVLSPLTTALSWRSEDSLIKTTAVKHLYNAMSARLKDDISDQHLIEALHPTPAMGGAPREAALKWITITEPFNRGLYAAPIGWMDETSAEFAVGIRSALIV